MLYIGQSIVLLIWLIYVIWREKYSLHAILTTYLLFVMITDIPEIFFNQILQLYRFPTQLLTDNIKDNQLGIVFSDGIILPMTNILICHYAIKTKKLWRVSLAFTATYGIMEWLYLKFGYLIYHKWSIWISIAIYFSVSRMVLNYASRLMLYKPPMSYFIRIGASTYAITAWFGAILGGVLLGFYQWRPYIINNSGGDDRLSDLGISYIFAVLSAIIVPRIKTKFRPLLFISFAVIAIIFSYYSHGQGWLIYHKWNNVLTALRWIIPFLGIIWLDKWESKYLINRTENK